MNLQKHKVGSYEVCYRDAELSGNHPPHTFYEFTGPEPIIEYKNFLSSAELDFVYLEILKVFSHRRPALVHDYNTDTDKISKSIGVHKDIRSTDAFTPDKRVLELLEQKLEDVVFPMLKEYYNIRGAFKRVERWNCLGYQVGDFFRVHCDSFIRSAIATNPKMKIEPGQFWYANNPHRKFTTLLYLNAYSSADIAPPGQYTGGELHMPRILKDGIPVQFKPEAGTLLGFPSNFIFMHEVKPITSGYRFSTVTWTDVV